MSDFVQVASIANRLREAMTLRGKKQIDLVRETGINRSAISRYLSGKYEPKNVLCTNSLVPWMFPTNGFWDMIPLWKDHRHKKTTISIMISLKN